MGSGWEQFIGPMSSSGIGPSHYLDTISDARVTMIMVISFKKRTDFGALNMSGFVGVA